MPTAEKAQAIEELATKLRESKGTVLLDYRGLTVAAITQLRRELGKDHIDFHVAKNTLLRIAAERAEVEITPDLLEGPTAVAFGVEDEVAPARTLTDFARRNRVVSIKGGVVGGRAFTAEQVGRLAALPTRDVLLAQLLGALQAPMAKTLAILQAPSREVAGLAEALRAKRESDETAA
jgi:large subunit ribosomal protein L10